MLFAVRLPRFFDFKVLNHRVMNTTRKYQILDIVFWIVFLAAMLLFSATSHTAFGVLSTFLFITAGLFLWIKGYMEAKKDENIVTSFPLLIFQLVFKAIIICSTGFALGNYPGSSIIALVAGLLVWVNVVIAAVNRRYADIAYSILVLQMVIACSNQLL